VIDHSGKALLGPAAGPADGRHDRLTDGPTDGTTRPNERPTHLSCVGLPKTPKAIQPTKYWKMFYITFP